MPRTLWAFGILFLLLAGATAVPAQESLRPRLIAGTDIGWSYGLPDSGTDADTVLQPYLALEAGCLSLSAWASFDAGAGFEDYSELDLALTCRREQDLGSIEIGATRYSYSDGSPSTTELFAGLVIGSRTGPYLELRGTYDIDVFSDYYVTGGLGYVIDLPHDVWGKISIGAGMVGPDYSASGKAGLYDQIITLAVTYMHTAALRFNFAWTQVDTLDETVYPPEEVRSYILAGITYTF